MRISHYETLLQNLWNCIQFVDEVHSTTGFVVHILRMFSTMIVKVCSLTQFTNSYSGLYKAMGQPTYGLHKTTDPFVPRVDEVLYLSTIERVCG